MAAEQVKFSGNLKHIVTEQTQNKFEGTAEFQSPRPRRVIVSIVVSITVTVTLAITLKLIFDIDILLELFQHSGQLSPPSSQRQPSVAQPQLHAATKFVTEASPLTSQALGLNGHVVIVRICNTPEETLILKLALRDARVNACYVIYQSNYVVFVGPFYSKNSADTALRAVMSLGYDDVYLVSPS